MDSQTAKIFPLIPEPHTKKQTALKNIVGKSPAIEKVKRLIGCYSQSTDLPVLITGETGTGKELVAEALHHSSDRAHRPFIRVNCAAIPESLFESQFFGHRKGAFSGACDRQRGLVEEAHGGTLFLDEISSLKLELQPKLLRFLEDGGYRPVGETRECKSSVWIIAASNQNLAYLVERGEFRADLYYRIKAREIQLPLLRERGKDILILAHHFLQRYAEQWGSPVKQLSTSLEKKFLTYSWPGNVRELRHCLTTLVHLTRGEVIQVEHWHQVMPVQEHSNHPEALLPLKEKLKAVEREHILTALKETGYQVRRAAKLLGISRNTLKKKLQDYEIEWVKD